MNGKDFVGQCAWKTLHSFAAVYTPENREWAKVFVNSYAHLFPCPRCREHFKSNLRNYPVDNYLDNNHNFFYWTYLIHDIVNKSIGKISPSYIEIKSLYFKKLGQACPDCNG